MLDILGINRLERRMSKRLRRIEERLLVLENHRSKPETVAKDVKKILDALSSKDMTTSELAKELGKHRSWISLLLNRLERDGKVKEVGKKGRAIVYSRI